MLLDQDLEKSCSAFWQILLNAILNCSSGLSGIGRYWRPTGQDFLSTKSLRTDSDRRLFARLVSSEGVLFLSWLKPSVCYIRLGAGAGCEEGISSSSE